MDKINLKVNKRDAEGKTAKALRREGVIPAVVYGKDKKNEALSVSLIDFNKCYRDAGGSSIVKLTVDGEGEKNVLIHDVELDPVKSTPVHVDFYEVSMNEKITTEVPLVFVGDSTAVIELGGSLITNKNEVEIEALPANLPHEIEVDISVLIDFEAAIHVSDIKAPVGVEIKNDPEELVANVEAPRSDEELEELEEPVEAPEMPEAEQGGEEPAEGEGGEAAEENKE